MAGISPPKALPFLLPLFYSLLKTSHLAFTFRLGMLIQAFQAPRKDQDIHASVEKLHIMSSTWRC